MKILNTFLKIIFIIPALLFFCVWFLSTKILMFLAGYIYTD